jgi:hypothetical protein
LRSFGKIYPKNKNSDFSARRSLVKIGAFPRVAYPPGVMHMLAAIGTKRHKRLMPLHPFFNVFVKVRLRTFGERIVLLCFGIYDVPDLNNAWHSKI